MAFGGGHTGSNPKICGEKNVGKISAQNLSAKIGFSEAKIQFRGGPPINSVYGGNPHKIPKKKENYKVVPGKIFFFFSNSQKRLLTIFEIF